MPRKIYVIVKYFETTKYYEAPITDGSKPLNNDFASGDGDSGTYDVVCGALLDYEKAKNMMIK